MRIRRRSPRLWTRRTDDLGRRAALVTTAAAWLLLLSGTLSPAPAISPDAVAGGADLEAMCGTLSVIRLPDGKVLCTHGPDPAPPGVDMNTPQPLVVPGHAQGLILPDPPGDAPTTAAGTPGIACYPDGSAGNRVHAIYAVPADRADRYAQVVPSIRQWAAEMDAVFQSTAGKTGGTRRVRFVTDGNCDLVVDHVRLSSRGDDTFDNTISELAAQGYNRPDRKYLVWMDSTALCGIATYYVDDRPTRDNFNNGNPAAPGSVARIDSGCWGLGPRGQSVEAHELMHSLGAVQPSAPHSTAAGHCDDDADRMCYLDGSILAIRTVCPSNEEAIFDCQSDDYFHTAPPPGNYLATHWNAANSSFLTSASSSPTVSIGDVALPEGDSGTVPFRFPVSLSSASSQPATVRFVTADAAARAPDDYVPTSGTLSFSPGETAKTITVEVKGDLVEEVDEPFSVVLSSPANALIGKAQAFGTILDNESTAQGYRFVAGDGGIFSYGDSRFHGSTGSMRLNQPVVGMAATPSGNGYWLVASDGGIFSFGDARFFGSTGNIRLNQPIVGMAATPTGQGYWFVAADGGVFAFGDARFLGAPAGVDQPIAAMAATPTGGGYWMASRRGAVYAFGDARLLGDIGGLNQPVVGMASTPKGGGYWLVARDGGIFSFGDARFFGSTGNIRLNQPIVGMTTTRGPA